MRLSLYDITSGAFKYQIKNNPGTFSANFRKYYKI